MVGVAYHIISPEMEAALERLGAATSVVSEHGSDLTAIAAAVGESATKRRISEEKRSPDGEPWPLWAAGGGQDRRPGQTLLFAEGNLNDSIAGISTATTAEVGSNLVYAAIHQLGGDQDQGHPPIPARPYLGLSRDDQRELSGDIRTFLEEVL